MNYVRRAAIMILKGIGCIAAIVFWFSPLSTSTGLLLFAASIVVGLLCLAALSNLDDDFLARHGGEGYWPAEPLRWDRKTDQRRDKA